ncbi:flagellar P-ring protein precursor FlgI [Paucimonas lemoignei]|uniref:Flagellar P-ring protein n=1 Tax=Paucimonas lemoignei TaxID=29443 RepID=A0A4R3HWP5_PAULE|nr:flagellar basal body P-ring protein FlgI [Paucimonas lemoignei]TCS37717.1 flagellar P-ring protein precursor FlgI [Paucimonas lemoignei]
MKFACILKKLALPLLLAMSTIVHASEQGRLKDLGRIEGWRDNQLVGYGLVTGLAGTGDSLRNKTTRQSLANLLSQFDIAVTSELVQSRNVAAVMITATLPPVASVGDKLDVSVTSIGDARSLLGGVLMMTPLKGPNGQVYALAQGSLSIGGYKYDLNGNVVQKNHPTVGAIPNGANVEVAVGADVLRSDQTIRYVLAEPDYTTSSRVADAINRSFGQSLATAIDGGKIEVMVPQDYQSKRLVSFLTKLEGLSVEPDKRAKVVVNERTGVVVAGGDVRINKVTITHGDLKVSIVTDYLVSQPSFVGPALPNVRTEVVPQTRIDVQEQSMGSIQTRSSNTVSDLVQALGKIKVSPRDMISILQGIKAAGALRAELIIQ